MKFAVVMFFTIFVAVISARRSARCSSSDDCDQNECCISRTFLGFRKGYCKPLARDGENCSADEDELFGGKFVMHCPCERGLSCEPTEVKDLGTVSVTAKRCRRARDCEETECCIDRGFIMGGICTPLAKDGAECNERDAKIHILSGKYVEHCPCEPGLFCEPEEVEGDGMLQKIFRDFRCTSERRTTLVATRKQRTTTQTEAPTEALTEA